MAEGDDFVRRLLLSVDAKGYSTSTGNWQAQIQTGLLKVLDQAAERAGLTRAAWHTQGAGDGELAVLPENEPEPRIVDDFTRHLHAELRRLNRDLPQDRRLRLRLAIHFGPAVLARNGFAGPGPITVSRLCDSGPVRRALDLTGAALAVIVSQRVYSETVEQEYTSLDPAMFRKVTVRVKEFCEDAWIWVPDHDISGLPLDPGPSAEPAAAPAPTPPAPQGQTVHGHFTGAQVWANKVVGGSEINLDGGDR